MLIRLKRRQSSSFWKLKDNKDKTMTGGSPDPEMKDSLVDGAAPMSDEHDDDDEVTPVEGEDDESHIPGSLSSPKRLTETTQATANASCPVQKIQNKLRLHNSTDPRPSRNFDLQGFSRNRDSISSTMTCTTCCSSPIAPRFSFATLLKPPSIGFLRFEGSGTFNSRAWRGSGWSAWFRQDENNPKERPQQGQVDIRGEK